MEFTKTCFSYAESVKQIHLYRRLMASASDRIAGSEYTTPHPKSATIQHDKTTGIGWFLEAEAGAGD